MKLYYGGRRAATMAYDALYKTWEEKHGVEVIPVLSQGGTKVRARDESRGEVTETLELISGILEAHVTEG